MGEFQLFRLDKPSGDKPNLERTAREGAKDLPAAIKSFIVDLQDRGYTVIVEGSTLNQAPSRMFIGKPGNLGELQDNFYRALERAGLRYLDYTPDGYFLNADLWRLTESVTR